MGLNLQQVIDLGGFEALISAIGSRDNARIILHQIGFPQNLIPTSEPQTFWLCVCEHINSGQCTFEALFDAASRIYPQNAVFNRLKIRHVHTWHIYLKSQLKRSIIESKSKTIIQSMRTDHEIGNDAIVDHEKCLILTLEDWKLPSVLKFLKHFDDNIHNSIIGVTIDLGNASDREEAQRTLSSIAPSLRLIPTSGRIEALTFSENTDSSSTRNQEIPSTFEVKTDGRTSISDIINEVVHVERLTGEGDRIRVHRDEFLSTVDQDETIIISIYPND